VRPSRVVVRHVLGQHPVQMPGVPGQSLGLGGVGFPRNWVRGVGCGWSRAGVAGDRCAARAPGRRRDQVQGGGGGAGCPARGMLRPVRCVVNVKLAGRERGMIVVCCP
jgi:hypothetical protein